VQPHETAWFRAVFRPSPILYLIIAHSDPKVKHLLCQI
jgi:hypothetical protein